MSSEFVRPDAPVAPASPQHHSFIDALRGVAIIAVIIAHAPMCVHGLSNGLSDFLCRGSLGVQLFYALSAFTLCASFRARGTERGMLAKYALRRVFRIVPMFWVAIVLFAIVGMYVSHWGPPHGFHVGGRMLVTALLLHGFDVYALNSVVPGGWSVAVEAQSADHNTDLVIVDVVLIVSPAWIHRHDDSEHLWQVIVDYPPAVYHFVHE